MRSKTQGCAIDQGQVRPEDLAEFNPVDGDVKVACRSRLGGMLNCYHREAA
jgi:hypothetical protein